jgi:ABC-2 type transport system ATP-binding protein
MPLPSDSTVPGTPALRVVALAKRFGAQAALRGVDLTVERGESFGLVGVNGAGKTTLIKCVLDLNRQDSGEVEVFGVTSTEPRARRRLSYFPERFTPPHYLRSREFLQLALSLAGMDYETARVAAMLTALELDSGILERPVRQLSKGMTQKLGLAGTFLTGRDLYVLDEPMSGLDPASRVAVKSALAQLNGEGRTLFFTSHVLADIEELCSAIAVLDVGRVLFRGSPALLCSRYGEARLERAFLRCIRDSSRTE